MIGLLVPEEVRCFCNYFVSVNGTWRHPRKEDDERETAVLTERLESFQNPR
jgi:hypothetical protein